ncbi:sulfite dehydrogenase (cytochrome) subunit SorA apoprotein [Streptosporangium subroseum]|uniref:Sulfite dehydrogenase (Cytochrome) subunit SorA apoprotein n=2 Tax=Streptosporangium subroseum TaxID=106412 RepID=A0A239GV69_9ACTN|nr:sulfite dehydrogenase (cytochrome) subunit SorA apoprotein [Streptosporangium subroseum]
MSPAQGIRNYMDIWDKRDDMVVHGTDPYNAEPSPCVLADRTLTPLDAFYSRNHGPIPDLDPASWRLTVDGLVGHPLTLSLEDLRSDFSEHALVATLQCAGNRRADLIKVRDIPGEDPWGPGAISTAHWNGVKLADVLARAELCPEAAHIAFAAPDVSDIADPPQPYGGSIPVAKAITGQVLLAWGMNGRPLPRAHGAPVRAIVPGWIGARSVKWLQRVTAQAEPSDNYFQATAYRMLPSEADPARTGPCAGISLGPVTLNTAILRPDDGARLRPGLTQIAGYAYAGENRAVARVDVSLDEGGTWIQADLDEQVSPWAWQHWRTTADLGEGETVITARAWDTAGATQPESARHLWNPKGYANTSWARIHVTCHS